MKKRFSVILVIVAAALMMTALAACGEESTQTYNVKYSINYGGSIVGETEQAVESGGDATAVTAVADEGYMFKWWSDGVETATRTDKNITEDLFIMASFKRLPKTYTLTYGANAHGRIEGETVQTVESLSSGTAVTAVPDEGYLFAGWSDGSGSSERRETRVTNDISVTANFVVKSITLKLDYNLGLGGGEIAEVTYTYEDFTRVQLPILTREGYAFCGWYLGETRVADEQGKSVANIEIIDYSGREEVRAKFQSEETYTYKILLVYVTEIDAVLPTRKQDGTIHVDYTMSALEREFCQVTTKQLKKVMDGMMDGFVEFEIDEYYTTETIRSENFIPSGSGSGEISNSLFPTRIPEVSKMLDSYQSVLTVFNLQDFALKLHSANGSAEIKYGEVNFESCYDPNYTYEQSIENKLEDLNHISWDWWLEVFVHELAHTIEMRINAYSYHKSCVSYLAVQQLMHYIKANKLYYLKEIEFEGIKAGIPRAFWKGEIAKATYRAAGGNGSIVGNGYFDQSLQGSTCWVVRGENAPTVTATPIPGFRFTRWSDGVTTAERTDENITEDFSVEAFFEPIEYTLNFAATAGGTIQGDLSVIIHLNESSGSVKAIPNEGYRFVGWSDGILYDDRYFIVNVLNVSLFDENNSLTITAIFKKIT